jgi:hypothetical protein
VPLEPRSMRSFDMDIFRLHTGAPWPLCVLSMAISWLSGSEQAYNILSQYQASYPAILDIATSLSLNKLFGKKERGDW